MKVTRESPKVQTPCFGENQSLRTQMSDQDLLPAAICVLTDLLLKNHLFLCKWHLGGKASLSDPIKAAVITSLDTVDIAKTRFLSSEVLFSTSYC